MTLFTVEMGVITLMEVRLRIPFLAITEMTLFLVRMAPILLMEVQGLIFVTYRMAPEFRTAKE